MADGPTEAGHHRYQHVIGGRPEDGGASSSPHWSRRRRPRSPSRCTATCPPGRSGCPRCGRATSSTRSPTFRGRRARDPAATGSPRTARALVDNDMLVTLRAGRTPCWPHLFLNHMLDPAVAKENFSAIGLPAGRRNSSPRIRWWPRRSYRRTCGLPIVKRILRNRVPDAGTRRGQRRRLAQRLERVQRRRILTPRTRGAIR